MFTVDNFSRLEWASVTCKWTYQDHSPLCQGQWNRMYTQVEAEKFVGWQGKLMLQQPEQPALQIPSLFPNAILFGPRRKEVWSSFPHAYILQLLNIGFDSISFFFTGFLMGFCCQKKNTCTNLKKKGLKNAIKNNLHSHSLSCKKIFTNMHKKHASFFPYVLK